MSVSELKTTNIMTVNTDNKGGLIDCKVLMNCEDGKKLREQISRYVYGNAKRYIDNISESINKFKDLEQQKRIKIAEIESQLKGIELNKNNIAKLLTFKSDVNDATKKTLFELSNIIKAGEIASKNLRNAEKEYNKDNLQTIILTEGIDCVVHIKNLELVFTDSEMEEAKKRNKSNMKFGISGYELSDGYLGEDKLIGEKPVIGNNRFKINALTKGKIQRIAVDTSGILGIGKGKKRVTVVFRIPIYTKISKKENNKKVEYYIGKWENKNIEIDFDNVCIADRPDDLISSTVNPYASSECFNKIEPYKVTQTGGKHRKHRKSGGSVKSSEPSDYSICE